MFIPSIVIAFLSQNLSLGGIYQKSFSNYWSNYQYWFNTSLNYRWFYGIIGKMIDIENLRKIIEKLSLSKNLTYRPPLIEIDIDYLLIGFYIFKKTCSCAHLSIIGRALGFLVLSKDNHLCWGPAVSGECFSHCCGQSNSSLLFNFILRQKKRKRNPTFYLTMYCPPRSVKDDEVDPEVKFYPDYCNSIFYVFDVPTATKIVNAAKVTQPLNLPFT